MEDCIFCKIANGEIPSKLVYEDEAVAAFYDLTPQAPIHVLIVPKRHYADILEAEESGAPLNQMARAAKTIARQLGLEENGFRLVINTGADGGQTVPHLHMHMMGGRAFGWPAG
ncbi:MAG: histidine triad nucleotide-binding protein [Christensenellaceae bacterium]|jgi:histidine triad (HIT) family protein|nr:histidine triad nucleotide-binding protein [Christensenellaceae bacterium]